MEYWEFQFKRYKELELLLVSDEKHNQNHNDGLAKRDIKNIFSRSQPMQQRKTHSNSVWSEIFEKMRDFEIGYMKDVGGKQIVLPTEQGKKDILWVLEKKKREEKEVVDLGSK